MSDATPAGDQPATETPTPAPAQVPAKRPDRTPLSQRDPAALAHHFANSGFFKDTNDHSKAIVKMVAGEELGIPPLAAMMGITIIEGKLGMTANLMATLLQQHPRYRYKVEETTDVQCRLAFYDDGEAGPDFPAGVLLGESVFTLGDAKRAGLVKPKSNWEKWPKAMNFARCLTQGVRTYCPAVLAGVPAYTPDELGATTDQAGNVVDAPEPVQGEVVTDAQVVTDDPPADPLDQDKVEHLRKGLDLLALTLPELNLILGACGIDAFTTDRTLTENLERLTPQEFEVLNGELDRELAKLEQDAAAEEPGQ